MFGLKTALLVFTIGILAVFRNIRAAVAVTLAIDGTTAFKG